MVNIDRNYLYKQKLFEIFSSFWVQTVWELERWMTTVLIIETNLLVQLWDTCHSIVILYLNPSSVLRIPHLSLQKWKCHILMFPASLAARSEAVSLGPIKLPEHIEP